MNHYSSKKFLPSEIRIMNLDGSDKPCVCRNALQTSLIREKSEEEFRALLIAKSKIGCKITILLDKYQIIYRKYRIFYNAFNIKRG